MNTASPLFLQEDSAVVRGRRERVARIHPYDLTLRSLWKMGGRQTRRAVTVVTESDSKEDEEEMSEDIEMEDGEDHDEWSSSSESSETSEGSEYSEGVEEEEEAEDVEMDDVSGLPAVADFEPTWRDQALAGEGKWEGPRLRAAKVEEVEEEEDEPMEGWFDRARTWAFGYSFQFLSI